MGGLCPPGIPRDLTAPLPMLNPPLQSQEGRGGEALTIHYPANPLHRSEKRQQKPQFRVTRRRRSLSFLNVLLRQSSPRQGRQRLPSLIRTTAPANPSRALNPVSVTRSAATEGQPISSPNASWSVRLGSANNGHSAKTCVIPPHGDSDHSHCHIFIASS